MHNFSRFSQLTRTERWRYLAQLGLLTPKDIDFLQDSASESMLNLSEHFTENLIGCFTLPLSIVPEFWIDQKSYTVPMVIEETSVIASISKTAKWIAQSGNIHTTLHGQDIIGQIQFPSVQNIEQCQTILENHSAELVSLANQHIVPNLVRRGGGVNHIMLRKILHPNPNTRNDTKTMAIVHVYLNPCDAMGANLVNQVCEFLRPKLETIFSENANISILSNLVDSKLTEATAVLKIDQHLSLRQAQKITEASLFAEYDPYRAATSNKGVMNGIDAVLIATGNDWRAVEAGMHAYACRTGQYRSITTWRIQENRLIGHLIAPIVVGTVGGVTKLHPTAQLGLKLLNITHSHELSRICAAVGLVQNLAAIRALTQEGIVKGHMTLHIKNLILASEATVEEQETLPMLAKQFFKQHHKITQSDVNNLLTQYRKDRDSKQ